MEAFKNIYIAVLTGSRHIRRKQTKEMKATISLSAKLWPKLFFFKVPSSKNKASMLFLPNSYPTLPVSCVTKQIKWNLIRKCRRKCHTNPYTTRFPASQLADNSRLKIIQADCLPYSSDCSKIIFCVQVNAVFNDTCSACRKKKGIIVFQFCSSQL